MNVVFLGTPDFAVFALKALIEEHTVKAVITQPDKPKGRGKKTLPPPVKEIALKEGIPVFQPENIKAAEFIEQLKKIEADIFVVVAYGQLLSEEILNMPKYGCVNIHGSLLPKYRGAAPIQHAIINGEQVTGVTIMYMDKGMDTGDIIIKKEIPIENDTYGSLHDKMAPIGAKALSEALILIENGTAKREKQDDALASYAKKISKEYGEINWNESSDKVLNLIRGLNPTPCAYTLLNGEIFKIYNGEKYDDELNENSPPGTITNIFPKKGFAVKTKDSSIIVTEVKAKGGKKMNCSDYMRGHKIDVGTVLRAYP